MGFPLPKSHTITLFETKMKTVHTKSVDTFVIHLYVKFYTPGNNYTWVIPPSFYQQVQVI
jgi:hypothetical protein